MGYESVMAVGEEEAVLLVVGGMKLCNMEIRV